MPAENTPLLDWIDLLALYFIMSRQLAAVSGIGSELTPA
jgi:hypothetical protein